MTPGYRILHLSDLHWHSDTAEDQRLIIGKLESDLRPLIMDKKPDIVVFSGDLVAIGQDAASFVEAREALFNPLQRMLGLSEADFLICPGNHDVDRKLAYSQTYIEAGLKAQLQNADSLNAHTDRYLNAALDNDDANYRLRNYFNFIRSNFHSDACFTSNYVDCIVKKATFGSVGFAVLNTAWRSVGAGESEKNQLLLAERVIDKASECLKPCDIRIAVLHHPLDWLARWSEAAVRNPLFANFDLVLFGHVHEIMPTVIANAIGECLFAQGGTLYLHRRYYNGYQLIDITEDEGYNFDFHLRTWFDQPRREFGPAENICAGGKKQFQVRGADGPAHRLHTSQLLAFQAATDDMANAHLRTLQTKSDVTFDDSFTCPPLSEKTQDELLQLSPSDYKKNLLDLAAVLNSNGVFVFSGSRESGKTTIAWKISKELLRTTNGPIRIPIIVDFSLIRKYDALDRLVRRHVGTLSIDLSPNKILAGHRCLFIVDNVSLADQEKTQRLKKLLSENNNQHDWCIFVDQIELLSSRTLIDEFGATRPPIFIQPFGRSEIRELVRKISPSLDESLDNTETIVALINDNNLPRNPYIVTVLTSILSNVTLDVVINEATLLDKMIDLLLNKGAPENMIRSSTDFAGLNILLEQIAQWLSAAGGYLSENELLKLLAAYLTDRGIQESASNLVRHFATSGILERNGDDVCFRYRSFESYFLARYAARNKDFAPKLLDDLAIVRHAKEFSLLCDLSRKDADLLSYLEIIILELRPLAYETADKEAFLQIDLKKNSEGVVDELLEHISGGPRTIAKIDETHDLHDRARSALVAKLQELTPAVENKMKEDEEAVKQLMRFWGYLQAWQCWGRAITSLDFVQLAIRKPSFKKFLDHWARFAAVISEGAHKFMEDLIADAQKEGKPFAEKAIEKFEYLARVQIPFGTSQIAFAPVGVSSIYQVLTESFDELDLQTPEAMGATCMLIRHRPPGWNGRVMKYIEANIQKTGHGVKKFFLLQAFYQEYYLRYLSTVDLIAIEILISELLSRAGFVNQNAKKILSRIAQNRPRIELITRELRR